MKLQLLKTRQQIITLTRQFFDQKNFQEITTPVLVSSIPAEQNIYPFTAKWSHSKDELKLSTSPESSLKQLISQGLSNCYSISHSFRNLESTGPTHQPEFLMLEYYQIGSDYINVMDTTEKYIVHIYERLRDNELISANILFTQPFLHISFQDLFFKYSPKTCLTDNEPQLNQDFLNFVDPQLKKLNQPIFITDYPAFISPLATPIPGTDFSQRFELYFGNLEIANGNTENLNPHTPVTWQNLPACAGCGLGIDRLTMFMTQSDHINHITPFPL